MTLLCEPEVSTPASLQRNFGGFTGGALRLQKLMQLNRGLGIMHSKIQWVPSSDRLNTQGFLGRLYERPSEDATPSPKSAGLERQPRVAIADGTSLEIPWPEQRFLPFPTS
jgi:hypothetical protein